MIKGRARLRRKGPQRVNALGIYGNRVASPDSSEASDKEMSLNSISAVGPSCHKAIVPVKINHERLEMIYDPGATQSVISEQMWHTLGKPPLQAAPVLVAYTDVPVETLGKTKVQVTAFGKTMRLHVHVVKKTDAPLFGLNWCMAFGLPLPQGIEIRSLRSETCDQGQSELPSRQEEVAQNLIKLYPDVFTNTAGTILGHEAEVHLREEVRPKLFKPRPVPFALKAQIDTELNRLLNDDVLEQVDPATMPIEWASPIVCVVKPSGKVRICGDFKKTMEQILAGIDGVAIYIDDIIITGCNVQQHMDRLHTVLKRLRKAGVHTCASKCKFMCKSVTYLGHRIDQEGIHPTQERIEAIRQMPMPSNVQELRSFLGAVNYYAKFVPGLQQHCVPLYRLTKSGIPWAWGTEETRLVERLKRMLTSSETLVHYDEKRPLILATDACEIGVGAVLSHLFPSGEERPIAFASRTLTETEKRYATIDKEALAIIFGVAKFAQYLVGRRFTLETDHKPLERIFGEKREVPKIASNRLTRWALLLSAYNYEVRYVPAKENAPADALSRLPMKTRKLEMCEKQPSGQLLNLRLAKMPVTKRELKRELYKDEILAKVIMFMERGWPEKTGIPTELKPFFDKKAELSFEDGILLRQGRIVPPTNLRNRMLATVHEGHPGIVAMKSMARFQVWWPGIDKEIETYVNQCEACQRNRQRPPEVPLLPWNVPAEPWTRIHVDIAGMFMDHYWLVVVDAHSKWLEVIPMKSTTTASVIKRLRKLFATFGLPRAIVSDNGPQFVSEEFEEFCDYNNVTHIKTAPYHPKSNGLAERAVRLFKDRLRASSDSVADVEQKLQRFLFSYRNSLHATTGRTPAELQLGRRLRTKLDLLKPALDFHIDKRLFKQAEYHDRSSRSRSFNIGDRVYVYEPNEAKQEKGVIIERLAENVYLVSYKGKKGRKHADHLRHRFEVFDVEPTAQEVSESATGKEEQRSRQERPDKWHFDTTDTVPSSLSSTNERRPVREKRKPTRPYDAYLEGPSLN
uniref:RNA-directed DNA polymerase n=1 Tax=Trichuris muris TaxID=70415 RepID=A0A5S6QLD9_TRIMR